MTFEEWDNQLAEQAIELEDAAEAMNISMDEINAWKEKGEVPQKAIDWLSGGQSDLDQL